MRNFRLEELIPKETFEYFGHSAWQLFPPDSLEMLDDLRDFFGVPITCNDWLQGGKLQFRGYRPMWCNVGAKGSMHRQGRAFDLDVEGYTAEQARQNILEHKDSPLLKRIQRMESSVGWLHIDTKPLIAPQERIHLFNP